MKKFLLLLVGVLFFVCNGVAKDWTIYCDTKNNGWKQVYLFYSSTSTISTAYYATGEKIGTSTIFKFTFSTDNDYAKINFSKSNTELKHDGTNGNGDYYTENEDANWNVYDNYLYVLNANSNGCASLGEYTGTGESTVVYKYSGEETHWAENAGADELALTYNKGDGTYSLTRTFANNKNFGIREYTNGKQTAWYYGVKGSNTISTVGQTYKAVTSGGSNWNFQLTEGEYTLTFNPTANTIVFTSTATPTIKTSYTIYFDAVRSGSAWANPHLTLGGVEVIGVADGSLIKYAFHAAAGAKIAFSNGSTTSDPLALANNTVYYVENDEITSASKTGYSSPTHEFTYDVWGQIDGKDWGSTPMTYFPDGTWRTAAINFAPLNKDNSKNNFGIRKLDKNGNQYTVNGSNKYGWIWCETADNTMKVGVKSSAKIEADGGTVNWKIDTSIFDGTTEYVLVFDPKDMTIVFINPTAVVATVATEATTINGANANNLNVSFTVADYYKGAAATNYTLSNGSFSAGAKVSDDGTVSFENVPYATNYTLKPDNGSAMPINIKLPTTTFEINKPYFTVVAPGSGSGNASLVVYFKANCAWWYNLPQIVCTCGGEPISGTVVWNSPEVGTKYEYDFAFIANGVVDYNDGIVADKTFEFVVTPVYPFAVEAPAATPAPSMMRAAANSFQYVAGAAVKCEDVEVTMHSEVSGVEGVMIEDEEAPVEYFNLQGQRVNGELAPGIYIRRQGSSVTKVRI